ncbi:MAG TPA: N-formylglutamate amidohydrolase [Stellaceae bacterium]|jgi:N-formylglutamate amidohydrolase|nr:N-formylglutamate amidohydrolase [Stellaceae bacterium]
MTVPAPIVVPGIIFRRDPVASEVPLVFDSPHSGTEYPADFDYACPLDILRTNEDTHIDDLYGGAPEHGATLLGALFPRSYLDVNRDVGDIDETLLDAPWPHKLNPGEKTRLGMGLVRRFTKPNLPVYARKLSVAEMERRIERCYRPYHAALQGICDRLHGKFGAVWLINCHSMPARGNAMSSDGPNALRADFVLGDRDGTTCTPELTDFVTRLLVGRGYSVKVNDPYKGVEIVRRHGIPAQGRHALQIEINRTLYMDENTLAPNDHYPTLKADLDHLIAGLASITGATRVQE